MPLYNRIWLQSRDDVPAAVKQLTSFYLENQSALDREWEALPPTFCHGDTHAGNTYLRADGTAGMFDWQQPHRMHGMRDVTYFIGWSLDPATRRAAEKDLLCRYLDGLAQRGIDEAPSLTEAFALHRLLMVDAWNSAWAPLAIYGDDEDLCDRLLRRFVETLLDLDTAHALRAAL